MASTYVLKNLSHERLLACLGDKPPRDLDAAGIEAYMTLLRVAGAILAATEKQLEAHDISQARLRVLVQLKLEGEPGVAPWELADHLGVSRATMTRFLDGLEANGLVERRASQSDRRSQVVRLSARGRGLVGSLLPERVRRIQRLMGALSAGDKKTLVALLRVVEGSLPRFSEEPR
jgi:DNA-binding MarR family transcriptional regulator